MEKEKVKAKAKEMAKAKGITFGNQIHLGEKKEEEQGKGRIGLSHLSTST